jgi:hypothetical protein
VVKVVLARVRSTRDQRGIQQEWGRITQENFRRLRAEAAARIDWRNMDPNAQGQVLGELVGKYFPPTTVWNTDCWWNANLGWKRADENSPWEPVVEVYQQERVRQACPPEVSTTAVYRSPA